MSSPAVAGDGRRRLRGRLALGVAVVVWCALAIGVPATRGAHVAVDEPQYLLSATSLAEDGDLDISDELADERWRAYHRSELPEQTAERDDGRRLSPHDPLLPLLLAGPVALGGWVGAKLAMAAMAGALAVALVAVAARLGVPEGRALLTVAAFSLAAPLAVYGTQLYPELPGALAVTVATGALLALPRRAAAAVLVLAAGALPWLSVKYAPVAAALAAVGLWRLLRAGHRRAAVATGVALAATAGVAALGHLALYDALTPYAAGDHFTGGELTVMGTEPNHAGRARRLLGLLVDRDFGLATWAPGWLLVLPAAGALVRRREATAGTVLGLPLAAGWAVATFAALTMHGWWWPGRQVVVVLPLAVLAVARWGPPAGLLVGALTLGSLTYLWLVVEGLADRLTLVVDPWDTTNPVVGLARAVLPDLADPGTADEVRWALCLAAAVALVVAGHRSAGRRAPAGGDRWSLAGGDRRSLADGDGAGLDEDAPAGEGAEPHHLVVDAHGHRAVG